MKPFLKSTVLLIGILSMLLAGCQKREPIPTIIIFDYSGQKVPGTFTGTYNASGGIQGSGTSLMTVQTVGDEFNCVYTLTPDNGGGTINMYSNCQMATDLGVWRIVKGTGIYSTLRGKGSLVMTYPGAGVAVRETFEGKVFKD